MTNVSEIRSRIEQAKGRRDLLQKNLDETQIEKQRLIELSKAIEEAAALIQITAKETQEKLRYHIQDIVQSALDTCFPGEYDFIVNFEIKRGRTEADMYLEQERDRINPMEASGGGVVDIISFALRLSAWTLSRTDNIIILDEPYKFLSANLRPLAGEILRELSEKLKLQILIVTHDPIMIDAADRVFEVSKKKGRSIVEVK